MNTDLSKFKINFTYLLMVLLCLSSCYPSVPQDAPRSSNQNYQPYQQPPYASSRQDGYYYSPPSYGYQQPGSRYYSNPYAFPPQNQYPYYDGDQYYVPPSYYGTNRSDNSAPNAANQKF